MPASTLIPKLIAGIAATVAIVLGLHTYTLPNHAGAAYSDIHDLISRALGDPQARLPGPPATLPVVQLNHPATGEADSFAEVPEVQPGQWVRSALARDSAALRGWLGSLVLVTAATHGDSVETTLWRVTTVPGCPWLSRLHATSVGRSGTVAKLVRLTGDCPAVPAPVAVEPGD